MDQKEQIEHLKQSLAIRTKELSLARDAALLAIQSKSDFLANVSHELKSPIQAIVGYVDVVREELESQQSYALVNDLDKVSTNAFRLLGLVNNLLEMARNDAGKAEVRMSSIDLADLLSEVMDTTTPLSLEHNNQMHFDVFDRGIVFEADRDKVFHILVNLISNACKFTENGEISLHIKPEQHQITFNVSDTGIGIPEEQIKMIFEPFHQLNGSENRRYGGTGLGLAISHQFCEMMSATLSVKSTLNKGSVFTLVIPQ